LTFGSNLIAVNRPGAGRQRPISAMFANGNSQGGVVGASGYPEIPNQIAWPAAWDLDA
jgi:hypothetical protein